MQPLLLSKCLCNVYSFRSRKGKQPLDLRLSLTGKRLYVTKAIFCHVTDYYSVQGKRYSAEKKKNNERNPKSEIVKPPTLLLIFLKPSLRGQV